MFCSFLVTNLFRLHLQGSIFRNNTSPFESGGAVFLWFPLDKPLANCSPSTVVVRKWNYTNHVMIEDCNFLWNRASCESCSGGGIYINNGNVTVRSCTLIDNSSPFLGGTIFVEQGTAAVHLINSTLKSSLISNNQNGQMIYSSSQSSFTITNHTSISMNRAASRIGTIVEMPLGNGLYLDETSAIVCPVGWLFKNNSLNYYISRGSWGNYSYCHLWVLI